MNVLSLFDGIAGARVALERANLKVNNYFASEIDKYAIKIAQKNWPDIVQLGNVKEIFYQNNALCFDEDYFEIKIDLLIGGSPCTDLSIAKQNRQGLKGEQSSLFYEYVRLLKEINPKYFLLENVASMKKEEKHKISKILGVEPILINSALLSAQNRKRFYWTNIQNITQPIDKQLYLKDIIQKQTEEQYDITKYILNVKLGTSAFRNSHKNIKTIEQKANCLFASGQNKSNASCTNVQLKTIPHGFMKEKIEEAEKYPSLCAQDPSSEHKIKCIQVGEADIKGIDCIKRVYSTEGKSPCLSTCQGGHREPKIANSEITWRKLTPTECERLQTFPDNYTALGNDNKPISDTQRYKALGNSFTVDVIAHILSFIKE